MTTFQSLRAFVLDNLFLLITLLLQLIVSHILLFFYPLIVFFNFLHRCSARPTSTSPKNAYFITGASSGIGAALSVALASDPSTASIHLSGRSRERLDSARRACRAVAARSTLRLSMVVADVVDEALMRREVLAADATELEEGCGGLFAVVACAGIASGQVARDANGDGFKSAVPILGTNLMGTIHAVAPIVPVFAKRRRGQIVIMSSLAGYVSGLPWTTAYAASKVGQRYWGECLRAGLEEHGVDVLTVCPGFVDTGMTAKMKGTVPMVSAQSVVKEVVQAMKRGGGGTLLWPRFDGAVLSVFNMLPIDVRYLFGKLMQKRGMTKNFLKSPN